MQRAPNKSTGPNLPEKIRTVVSELPAFECADSIVQYVDRRGEGVWRVTGDGGDFAVRFRSPDLTNSLKEEFERMRHAAIAGIAPTPIAYDDRIGWIVSRWADGNPIRISHRPSDSELECVARICARLHGLEQFEGPPADPAASLESYLARLGNTRTILPKGFPAWRDRALKLSDQLSSTAKLAPCHNDLFPANIVTGAAGSKLIDWEYAADNDPAYDLAGFAVCASLGLEDVESLTERYLRALTGLVATGPERNITSLSRVRGWMIVAAVSWLPWALADDTMPPQSKAVWTNWARRRYENVTAAVANKDCEEIIENCT